MPYELVELSTGNLVGYYETEEAALADVRHAIGQYGESAVHTLALGLDDQASDGHEIARGRALMARALGKRLEPASAVSPLGTHTSA
jgi:hypothetical protein